MTHENRFFPLIWGFLKIFEDSLKFIFIYFYNYDKILVGSRCKLIDGTSGSKLCKLL